MNEKPSYIKTKDILISEYYVQLTDKEKKDIETMLIQLGYLKLDELGRHEAKRS